jgi:hypothetical protein
MADIIAPVYGFLQDRLYKTPEQDLVFGAADTVKSFTIDANSRVHSMIVHHPVFANAVTLIVSVENADGRVIYKSDAIANPEAAADELLAQMEQFVAINGECTVKATLSGAPGGAGGTDNIANVLCR